MVSQSIGRSVSRSISWLVSWFVCLLVGWLLDRLVGWSLAVLACRQHQAGLICGAKKKVEIEPTCKRLFDQRTPAPAPTYTNQPTNQHQRLHVTMAIASAVAMAITVCRLVNIDSLAVHRIVECEARFDLVPRC